MRCPRLKSPRLEYLDRKLEKRDRDKAREANVRRNTLSRAHPVRRKTRAFPALQRPLPHAAVVHIFSFVHFARGARHKDEIKHKSKPASLGDDDDGAKLSTSVACEMGCICIYVPTSILYI